MGAWGEGPFENDSALDWFDSKMKGEIENTIQEAYDKPNRGREGEAMCAIRCAVMLCADGRLRAFRDVLTLAKSFLEELKVNEAYLSSWREPDVALRQIRKELARVNMLVRLNKIDDDAEPATTVIKFTDADGFPTRFVRKRKKVVRSGARVVGRRVMKQTARGPVAVYERVEDPPKTKARKSKLINVR